MKVQGVVVNVLRKTDKGAEYLYLKRSGGQFQDQWWPVTGIRKEYELPIESALRELMEEVRMVPECLYDLGLEIPHMDGVSKLAGYVAFVGADSEVVLNYEHSEFKWLSYSDVFKYIPKSVHNFIEHVNNNFVKQKPSLSMLVWGA